MDPKVTLTLMLQCAEDGEMAEAMQHAKNLLDWLDRGGFAPLLRISADDIHSFLVADELADAFCRAACRSVLESPTPDFFPEP